MSDPVFKFVGAHAGAILLVVVTLVGWTWTASSKNAEFDAVRHDQDKMSAAVEAIKTNAANAGMEQTQMRVDLATIKRDLQWLVRTQGGPGVGP